MEAKNSKLSRISLLFGQPSHVPTPFFADFTVHLSNQQKNNDKAQLLKLFDAQIPDNHLAFCVTLKSTPTKQEVQKVFSTAPSMPTIYITENKVLFIINDNSSKEFLDMLQAQIVSIVQGQNLSQNFNLRVQSKNSWIQIAQLIKKQGPVAYLHSLNIIFEFIKTKTMTNLLQGVLSNLMGPNPLLSMIKTVNRLNFELKCSSSENLNEFKKIKYEKIDHYNKSQEKDTMVAFFNKYEPNTLNLFIFNSIATVKGTIAIERMVQIFIIE